MNALLISLVAATLGVDFGWERLPDGGAEYIIQFDRETLDALRDGQPIQSDVMPAAGEVRSFRIVVGNAMLARDKPLEKPIVAAHETPPKPLPADPAVKPLAGSQANYTQEEKQPAAGNAKPPSEKPAKPWLPFTLTLLGLFASLGANAYLGWLSWGLRNRRRAEIDADAIAVDAN